MNDETQNNIFDLYSGKSVSPDIPDTPPVYQAHAFGWHQEPKPALMFYFEDETLVSRPYASLKAVISHPPHDRVEVVFECDVIILEGTSLGALVGWINTTTIEAVGCFHTGRFTDAPEGEPVIYRMWQEPREPIESVP